MTTERGSPSTSEALLNSVYETLVPIDQTSQCTKCHATKRPARAHCHNRLPHSLSHSFPLSPSFARPTSSNFDLRPRRKFRSACPV